MKENRLYRLLYDKKLNLPASVRCVIPRKNAKGICYILCQLAALDEPSIKIEGNRQLFLESHHITFHEKILSYGLGEYHYTAVFRDTSGSQYWLHNYFSQNDHMTKLSPVLTEKEEQKSKRIHCSDDVTNKLKQLSYHHLLPVIKKLRNAQKKLLEPLTASVNKTKKMLWESGGNPKNDADRLILLREIKNTRNNILKLQRYSYLDYTKFDSELAVYEKNLSSSDAVIANEKKNASKKEAPLPIFSRPPRSPLFFSDNCRMAQKGSKSTVVYPRLTP